VARERVDVVEPGVVAVGRTKNRSPEAGPMWCSTWYSTPSRRGVTRRNGSAGRSASTNHTSVVSFDAVVITTYRPLRVRSTDT
jgi:hypothetical protein